MSQETTTLFFSLGGPGGLPYGLTFAGQATPWQQTLAETTESARVKAEIEDLIARGHEVLAPLGRGLSVVTGGTLTLESLLADSGSNPSASMPGILLAQFATLLALSEDGFDTRVRKPAFTAGHSQGVLGASLYEAWVQGDQAKQAQIYALSELLGGAVTAAVRADDSGRSGDRFPMLAIQKALQSQVQELIDAADLDRRVWVSLVNGPDQVVVSGKPADLEKLKAQARKVQEREEQLVSTKQRGGKPFSPEFTYLKVDAPFHSPLLQPALEKTREWSRIAGIDSEMVEALAPATLTNPVDWAKELAPTTDHQVRWILDVGPGKALTRITSNTLIGSGIGVVETGTVEGRDAFLTVGTVHSAPADWSSFSPKITVLPNGKKTVETAFTRLTGRSPILLAGMTPTTVDPEIVAAAANKGFWAEMAGGGQVTDSVFADNLAKLKTLLDPGRAIQFNAMFLDPYLWNLQFGAQSIVIKARAAGAPLDGVVISAGIPELEEATALIQSLQAQGFPYVAFKPGTVAQIRQVIDIARAVPDSAVIVQIEDGHAGGHHSWENLDDLLLATYADIRATPNLVLCAGGGIGTPERAADYISGQWARAYDRPLMPVDGVLIGTAAMTALEAKTSAEVKQLLVDTPGIPSPIHGDENAGWVGSGQVRGGVTSGQSHLRADIHEVDNAAAACARLVSQVSGHEDQVQERRAEIIAALDSTSKPYFGDVDSMTYLEWAQRFAQLSCPWIEGTWINRFQLLLQRIEGRLSNEETGEIVTLFPTVESVTDADTALGTLAKTYPNAATTRVTPTDAAWFVDLCRKYPKPMPFVPVVDADILRWWGQDNLWQSQEDRYTADQVRIIPGPVSVAGIDRVDEPIGDLLGRFENACVDRLDGTGTKAEKLFARLDDSKTPLDFILATPYVSWSGNLVDNPARVVPRELLTVDQRGDSHIYDLNISLDASWDQIPGGDELHAVRTLNVPLAVGGQTDDGGYPVVDRDALPEHMYALLASTAGIGGETITGDVIGALPTMVPSEDSEFGEAHWTFTINRELADLHRGATGAALPSQFHLSTWTPDALLGLCWPAIYAALGSALVNDYPVIEGLLSAVHLDHTARLDVDIEDLLDGEHETQLTVVARTVELAESSAGRVVTVKETLFHEGNEVGEFQERFAIRGRIGSDSVPVDVSAASGLATNAIDTPRSQLRKARVYAPSDMTTFANVSGDFNPIHTSHAAARVAGLEAPLVHGMWLSAVAQNLVQADDGKTPGNRIQGWTYNMYGLVNLHDPVDITVERIGRIAGGGLLLEVTCKIDGQIVSRATAATEAPVTAYVYPGQGIQRQGMALDEMATSEAAREVWERADALTKRALGFSILTVVRDNPTELEVAGQVLRHPDGILNLTQFTQVALATVAFAQTAHLRELGALVDHAFFAGHSLGEYNALSAYGEVFPLETVLEIVFHRGSTMHHLVERDPKGRSNYRMGALRPNQFGVGDEEIVDYVQTVSDASGEFLQIVNFNLAGQQYAVAGTIAGLEALDADSNARATAFGGKRPFMYVPGVDVPFHSSVLRGGVPEFRDKLEQLLPDSVPTERLVGKYIPNLVARPFEATREFAQAILDEVPSKALKKLLGDEKAWSKAAADPDKLSRLLLIELLCWQFASPVRWIETQELMFSSADQGGLGVERLIEIGLGTAPTLAGLGEKTLKLDEFVETNGAAYNVQRDEQIVTCTDVRFVEDVPVSEDESAAGDAAPRAAAVGAEKETAEATLEVASTNTAVKATVPAATPAPAEPVPAAIPAPTGNGPAADIRFAASDAIRVVMAFTNKLRPEQIEDGDTTDTLTAGVSARRNQLLMDLSAELGLPSIDGAADASVGELAVSVDKLAHHYRAFGPVLTEAIRDRLRKVLGGAGVKSSFVADRVKDTWQLGDGWANAVTAQVLLGSREGDSARGGTLATLPTAAGSLAEAEALVDEAVKQVGAARGVAVAIPSVGGSSGGGGVVDSAALDAYAATVTGGEGALAQAARHMLEVLGLEGPALLENGIPSEDEDQLRDALAAETVAAELGPRWVEMVQPSFAPERAILIDDRWASAREDLARLWESSTSDTAEDTTVGTFAGAGEAVAKQALWWANKATHQGLKDLEKTYLEAAKAASERPELPLAGQVAVVTGVTPSSIAGAVAARLLAQGATVIATSSRIDSARLDFAKRLYRQNAAGDAALWLVPANLASYRDVDALIDWIGNEQVKVVGASREVVKPAQVPDLFFPFAAPSVMGSMADSGEQFEAQARLLLWSVERAIAGFASLADKGARAKRVHVVLPGSPNRGMFGGDGAYGETKAAFDAITNRWAVEPIWARATSIAHPKIGWVQGTGLMGGNDPLVGAAQDAGIHTYTTEEMADQLVALCTAEAREKAAEAPLDADLTGGLSEGVDLRALQEKAMTEAASKETRSETADGAEETIIPALPSPPRATMTPVDPSDWKKVDVPLEEMVVVVSIGEIGPWGSARTRWQAELGIQSDGEVDLTPAGVLELAWMMGLLTWQESPESGWYDHDGSLVEPHEVFDRFRDEVIARSGVRKFINDAGIEDLGTLEEAAVFLNTDVTFTVPDRDTAESYVVEEPRLTRVRPLEDGEWEVTRLAGSQARLPRRATLTRTVGGQFPTGFDPAKWGLSPSLLESMDRIAAWNLVSAVDAFISAGFSPAELLQAVHPADVASTQGTGFGGMTSMRKLFVDRFLGEDYPQDILQETLPNVVAAHTMQSYIGGYGPMVQPVSACATAAVSVEDGVDKIHAGKAKFVVAGATDDLSVESLVGFGSMNATANSKEMESKGISDRFFSRANDRRRGGFIESQGGGTVLLARGDVAAELGLPVQSVIAYAQSFADGIHTSIPAPGLGALAAARGGKESKLARSLERLGLSADDVAFVSKHDTSTNANDPNESDLHSRVAAAIGRSEGNPMFVVSQKSVTGHAKGGACVFQISGVGQVFRDGVLPANKALDCVDSALAQNPWLVWLREPLSVGQESPIKAALVTSLGFGHVSSLLALAHPGVFQTAVMSQLGKKAAEEWRSRAQKRLDTAVHNLESGMLGRTDLYVPAADRRLPEEGGQNAKEVEAAMLLDPEARLGADGRYA
ncbi:fatty acid synthase subunit beta domain-containing protein [Actinomycetaceae bacterium MB13-C1-2]|nr:fatty acid synthase subunit beta domain-containing protein [Actinomycetaceae bacterium MB13-C1-2]